MAFKNIVVFGAGGENIGHHVVHALVKDGTFNVTVLARESSKTTFPSSVKVVKVADEFPHEALVKALQGQDVVLCGGGVSAHQLQYKIIDAAVEAGIKRFIPSEWGFDNGDIVNQDLNFVFKSKADLAEYLKERESDSFSWTAVATSIWLEWALNGKFVGIDPVAHKATYWSNGTHAFSNTTLKYSAEAALQLLKNPEVGKNQRIFVTAFEASQAQIVAELEKQQGVKYEISYVDGEQLVRDSKAKWESEKDMGAMYTTITASILMPTYKANFVTSKKEPRLEDLVKMPKLTLEELVQEWAKTDLPN